MILVFFFLSGSAVANASQYDDLLELKKLCDAKLLTGTECQAKRAVIMAKYDKVESPADEWFCNYSGETTRPTAFNIVSQANYSESGSASSIVKEILDAAGLAPNFIVRPANVPNAAASARGEIRYVEYNPAFIAQLKAGTKSNWSVYSVMAHELGHHLQGHTLQIGGSRPSLELEADEYSGFILAKLGASLSNAEAAMRTFGSNSQSGTHPPADARLAAIKKGWDRGSQKSPLPSTSSTGTSPMPRASEIPPQSNVTYTDSCVVNGEAIVIAKGGAVISKVRGYSQVGQKVAPLSPSCSFDLVSNNGRYCVAPNGAVHFGSPVPVGQCAPCTGNLCN